MKWNFRYHTFDGVHFRQFFVVVVVVLLHFLLFVDFLFSSVGVVVFIMCARKTSQCSAFCLVVLEIFVVIFIFIYHRCVSYARLFWGGWEKLSGVQTLTLLKAIQVDCISEPKNLYETVNLSHKTVERNGTLRNGCDSNLISENERYARVCVCVRKILKLPNQFQHLHTHRHYLCDVVSGKITTTLTLKTTRNYHLSLTTWITELI